MVQYKNCKRCVCMDYITSFLNKMGTKNLEDKWYVEFSQIQRSIGNMLIRQSTFYHACQFNELKKMIKKIIFSKPYICVIRNNQRQQRYPLHPKKKVPSGLPNQLSSHHLIHHYILKASFIKQTPSNLIFIIVIASFRLFFQNLISVQ